MFRRLSNTLPKDPEFPEDLEKLGYFINENDQIRSTANPDQEFNFFISKNERVRDVQREAMNTCIRSNLSNRFAAAGLITIRLSGSTPNSSPTEPHIPILTTSNLSTASRVLLYFGESYQDLGVLAYRTIGKSSIASGSILNFVSAAKARAMTSLSDGEEDLAIVVVNIGQLLWHRRGAKAVTMVSWEALPRKTGVDLRMRIDPMKNRVEGHRNGEEHVRSVMEYVSDQVNEGAEFEMIGIGNGADELVKFLETNWNKWAGKVMALCVGLGYLWNFVEQVRDEGFGDFWGKRARAYLIHNEPLGTPLYGREKIGCNCFSSGENTYVESIMPQAYSSMLEFFELVHNLPGYEEQPTLVEPDGDNSDRIVSWDCGKHSELVEKMRQSMIGVTKAE